MGLGHAQPIGPSWSPPHLEAAVSSEHRVLRTLAFHWHGLPAVPPSRLELVERKRGGSGARQPRGSPNGQGEASRAWFDGLRAHAHFDTRGVGLWGGREGLRGGGASAYRGPPPCCHQCTPRPPGGRRQGVGRRWGQASELGFLLQILKI